MKKIISGILSIFFLGINFIHAEQIFDPCISNMNLKNCAGGIALTQKCTNARGIAQRSSDGENCECSLFIGTPAAMTTSCGSVPTEEELKERMNKSTTTTPCTPVMGITCCKEELINGQCKLNIYDTLGIRKSVRNKGDATSVGLFVQDVVLSATFFIGTLVTIALIVSGIMFIFASSSGKDPANAKKGIIGSLVGLLIVVSSYVIIRLVQYIAKGF